MAVLTRVQVCLLAILFAGAVAAQDPAGVLAVGNGDVAAHLIVGTSRQPVAGRMSFHAILNESEMEVRAFNLVFFRVPQKPLAGDQPVTHPRGVLGFTMVPGESQQLQFDPVQRRIFGRLRLIGDAAFLIALAEPVGDGDNDVFAAPGFPAIVNINLQIVSDVARSFDMSRGTTVVAGFQIGSAGGPARPFKLEVIGEPSIAVDLGAIPLFETERKLCIQPVQLKRGNDLSGDGLAFGQPGAATQWAKADIVFTYRGWITIPAGKFWELKDKEAKDLLAKVNVDDCIEVFFPDEFKPRDLWGGGSTWNSGMASAKVISSDGNARAPRIDFTHLAHELGHVLRLGHPREIAMAPMVEASTNTLMCESGFKVDNPQRNSVHNAQHAANPLLTFSLRRRTAGPNPDCTANDDCGPCP